MDHARNNYVHVSVQGCRKQTAIHSHFETLNLAPPVEIRSSSYNFGLINASDYYAMLQLAHAQKSKLAKTNTAMAVLAVPCPTALCSSFKTEII